MAADPLPVLAVPAISSFHLDAVQNPDQCRDHLDAEPERLFQRFIEHQAGQAGRIAGIVLHINRQWQRAVRQLVQQRLDQGTGRALALGDNDQSIGQQVHGVFGRRRSTGPVVSIGTGIVASGQAIGMS